MKLRYVTTRKAVIFASVRAIAYNRALRLYLVVLLAGVIGYDTSKDIKDGHGVVYIGFGILVQLFFAGILLGAGVASVTALSLYLGRGKGVLGEHELTLGEAGMTEKTEYNETLHRWKGLGPIRVTPGYYFIRTNESNGSYHLVPRRGHVVEGDAEAFIAELRARLAAHSEDQSNGVE